MVMHPVGKMLIVMGVLLLIAGLWVSFGPRIPWLGKLPGDIRVEGKQGSFYFPVVTCIVISVVLSLIMSLFRR